MTDTPEINVNAVLFSKLAKVMGELSRVPKAGKNANMGYMFATDADVSDAVRTKLAEQNVAFFASMVEWQQGPVNEKGNLVRTIATFEFTFVCGDTGAVWPSRWTAEATDTLDKGFNKAATAALKYFLLKTFMLSTGDSVADDPDSDGTTSKPTVEHRDRRAERSIGEPKSNGNGHAPLTSNAQGEVLKCHEITIQQTKDKKPFYLLDCGIKPNPVLWNGEMLRKAGLDTDAIKATNGIKLNVPLTLDVHKDEKGYYAVDSITMDVPF